MGLRFEEVEPVKRPVEDIVVMGKTVGRVEVSSTTPRYRYHASIQLNVGYIGLIQGHGNTQEEAVKDAVAKGLTDTTQLLQAVRDFARQLELEEGANV